MYKENEVFQLKKRDKTKIWRYLDFTKFVYLIMNKSLYFSRPDKLSDPFEGVLPDKNLKNMISRNKKKLETFFPDKDFSEVNSSEFVSGVFKDIRSKTAVNCWHINNYESDAMWKIYSENSKGISIQSTYNRLKECFSDINERHIFIGEVEYINFDKDEIKENNFLYPLIYKRKSFVHERELRAVVEDFSTWEKDINKIDDNGISIPIKLDILIEKIILSPTTPKWLMSLTKNIVKNGGLSENIVELSNLSIISIY